MNQSGSNEHYELRARTDSAKEMIARGQRSINSDGRAHVEDSNAAEVEKAPSISRECLRDFELLSVCIDQINDIS